MMGVAMLAVRLFLSFLFFLSSSKQPAMTTRISPSNCITFFNRTGRGRYLTILPMFRVSFRPSETTLNVVVRVYASFVKYLQGINRSDSHAGPALFTRDFDVFLLYIDCWQRFPGILLIPHLSWCCIVWSFINRPRV